MTLLEAGCGVGNCLFPLLEEDLNIFAYACDFSPRAVDYVKVGAPYSALSDSSDHLSNSSPRLGAFLLWSPCVSFSFECTYENILIQSKARRIQNSAPVLHSYHLLYRFVSDSLHYKSGSCDQCCAYASQNSHAQSSVMTSGGNKIP